MPAAVSIIKREICRLLLLRAACTATTTGTSTAAATAALAATTAAATIALSSDVSIKFRLLFGGEQSTDFFVCCRPHFLSLAPAVFRSQLPHLVSRLGEDRGYF